MTKPAVTIEGLTETQEALRDMPEQFRIVAAASIAVGIAIIEGEALARVPQDEGDLKASIGSAMRSDGLQGTVGSGEPYAKFVEFATEDTPAQPFLFPAFRIGARYVRKAMRESWIQKVGQKLKLRTKRKRNPLGRLK